MQTEAEVKNKAVSLLADFFDVEFQSHEEEEEDEPHIGDGLQHIQRAVRENGARKAWDVSEACRSQQYASQYLCTANKTLSATILQPVAKLAARDLS